MYIYTVFPHSNCNLPVPEELLRPKVYRVGSWNFRSNVSSQVAGVSSVTSPGILRTNISASDPQASHSTADGDLAAFSWSWSGLYISFTRFSDLGFVAEPLTLLGFPCFCTPMVWDTSIETLANRSGQEFGWRFTRDADGKVS